MNMQSKARLKAFLIIAVEDKAVVAEYLRYIAELKKEGAPATTSAPT